MRRPVLSALGAVAVTAMVAVGPASAAPAGSTTHPDDTNVHGATDQFVETLPCHEELGAFEFTLTYNGQVHSTANANGFWLTATETGTFAAVPIGRDGETFAGTFTDWYGTSINPHESTETDTFRMHAVGSAGTSFDAHENSHRVTAGAGDPEDPNTQMKREFEHAVCH